MPNFATLINRGDNVRISTQPTVLGMREVPSGFTELPIGMQISWLRKHPANFIFKP